MIDLILPRPRIVPATPMLVARGVGMDTETVLSLMRRLEDALRLERDLDRMTQHDMTMDGITFTHGPKPHAAKRTLRVADTINGRNDPRVGDHKDCLVLHGWRKRDLVIRMIGTASPHSKGAPRDPAHPNRHPAFAATLAHGMAVTRLANDAVRRCLHPDLPSADDLVSTAVVAATTERTVHSSGVVLAMKRCTLATPLSNSRTIPDLSATPDLSIGPGSLTNQYRHPFLTHRVPAIIVEHVDGEIRLVPVTASIERDGFNAMTMLRHHDAEIRIMAKARAMGLVPTPGRNAPKGAR
jgi:hypothetical protein